MNVRSSDIYLNTLCLAAWAPGPSTIKLAKAAVRTFEDLSPDERTMITPINLLYVKLIREVIDGKLDLSNKAEAQNVLSQYETDPAFATNKADYVALKTMLLPDEALNPTAVRRLVKKVRNKIIWHQNSKRIRALSLANARAGYDDDPEKQEALLKQILEDAAEFAEIYNSQNVLEDDSKPIEEIDFDDMETLKRGMRLQHKKRDETNVIKFGWQGLNLLFGGRGGACYGESMMFAGLSHNGKSFVLQSMCVHHAVYNKPPDCGGKKPLILFISLENEAHENMVQFYRTLYVNTFHKEPTGMSDDEICAYLSATLTKNGFHVRIVRKLGENFGYSEYAKYVEDLETKQNFRVVATYLDYATLCKREKADSDKNDAKQIENMTKRFTDHSNQHGIFFCTAFQLDAEAARLKASGQTMIAKRFTEAHCADSKGAIRAIDIMFFNDIEINHLGSSYLNFAWRKHRYVNDTEVKFVSYRFSPLGILADINGEPQYTLDPYEETTEDSTEPEQAVNIF